ncbi:MAG: molybdenum cofactor guanylyltransferase [Thermodesulfobacteriota bacterium]
MSAPARDTLTGLVLAGGRSTRLGRDKVELPVHGQSLLARTVALAARFCGRVVVSGRNPADLGLDLPWLPDDVPGQGPLGGILTGLTRLGGPLLVLACDLPLLDADTVARLVEHRAVRPPGTVVTTFLQAATGFIEPLVAVYEAASREHLAAALEAGERKLARALPEAGRHLIPYGPEQAHAFFNINYPADLAILGRLDRCAENGA